MTQQHRQPIRENLLLALDTLRTHKFRSFLTLLGVLIGTATVIGVASIFKGTRPATCGNGTRASVLGPCIFTSFSPGSISILRASNGCASR